MSSSLASGIVLRGTDRTVKMKPPGSQLQPPNAWSPLSVLAGPDHRLEIKFPDHHTGIVVNAHSIGTAIIPKADPMSPGIPDLGNENWMAVVASFKTLSQGAPGSLLNASTAKWDCGADLFGYYLDGSRGIDTNLVGKTLLEQDRVTMGFPTGGSEDIQALDFGLGVNAFRSTVAEPLFFKQTNKYYFSVSKDCLGYLNGGGPVPRFALDKDGTSEVDADSAAVYVMDWSAGSWSRPQVYRSAQDLGLQAGVDDIDALDVDPSTTNGTTVFSTVYRQEANRSQLLMHQADMPNTHATFKNEDGDAISSKLGTVDDTDELDAVCIEEPEGGMIYGDFGISTSTMGPEQSLAGISVTRTVDIVHMEQIVLVEVTGWGTHAPTSGSVELYAAHGPQHPMGWTHNLWVSLGSLPRSSTQETVVFPIPVPWEHQGTVPHGIRAVVKDHDQLEIARTLVSEFKR